MPGWRLASSLWHIVALLMCGSVCLPSTPQVSGVHEHSTRIRAHTHSLIIHISIMRRSQLCAPRALRSLPSTHSSENRHRYITAVARSQHNEIRVCTSRSVADNPRTRSEHLPCASLASGVCVCVQARAYVFMCVYVFECCILSCSICWLRDAASFLQFSVAFRKTPSWYRTHTCIHIRSARKRSTIGSCIECQTLVCK